MGKHIPNIYTALYRSKSKNHNIFNVTVDKYSGNRYIIIDCKENKSLIGMVVRYGHGLYERHKVK